MTKRAPRLTHKPIAPVHKVASTGTGWRQGKTTAERGYNGKWQRARADFLAQADNVLCRMCQAIGLVELATVVDHIVPHKGDMELFWDRSNWQPLCKRHHDREKQQHERRAPPGGEEN